MTGMPVEITNFFLAMQAGPPGLGLLWSMFAPDAEYSEPFSGQSEPHKGPDAIVAAFAASRSDAFDDAVIELGAVEVTGETITVDWTCISQAIPGGRGSGKNLFKLRDGKIISLKTTLGQESLSMRNPEVDAWLDTYENPMKPIVSAVRDVILDADERISESIKWQAPTFSYKGNIASFFPKAKKHAALMFHKGAEIPGDFPNLVGDGKEARSMKFTSLDDLEEKTAELQNVIRAWCKLKDGG